MIRGKVNPALEKQLQGVTVLRTQETSFLGLKPGDLIQFNYRREDFKTGVYYGLVVASKKTGSGCYRLSTRNNTLVNVITADGLSQTSFNYMINNLYRNWILSKYPNKSEGQGRYTGVGRHGRIALEEIFNEDNFKTFIVHYMYDIMVISLKE